MKLITNKEQSKEAAIFLLNRYYGDLKTSPHKINNKDFIVYSMPKSGLTIMSYDFTNGDLFVIYFHIWFFLEDMFDYDDEEIQEVIKQWAEKKYKIKINDIIDELGTPPDDDDI